MQLCLCNLTHKPTSVPQGLPPQDLADNSRPHGLDLSRAGLEYKRVLRLPATEPDLKAKAAVADVLRHADLRCLRRNPQVNFSSPHNQRQKEGDSYFEGLFVDIKVISSFYLLGLAEEDEVFEQEDVAEVLPASAPDDELVLAAQLTLLLQVHLERKHPSERTMQLLTSTKITSSSQIVSVTSS